MKDLLGRNIKSVIITVVNTFRKINGKVKHVRYRYERYFKKLILLVMKNAGWDKQQIRYCKENVNEHKSIATETTK